MAKQSGYRGVIIVLAILAGIAVAAFVIMRNTVEPENTRTAPSAAQQGAPQSPGTTAPPDGQSPGTPPSGQGGALPGGEPAGRTGDGAGENSGGQSALPGGAAPGEEQGTLPGQGGAEFRGRVHGLRETDPQNGSLAETPGILPSLPGETDGQGVPLQSFPGGENQAAVRDVPYPAPQTPEESSGAAGPLTIADDMAHFLVNNYWPKGTHPAAVSGGISTAGLKAAAMRYGTESHGIRLGGQAPVWGAAALARFFTPQALDALFAEYGEAVIISMRAAAEARRIGSGAGARPLSGAEQAEMFAIYSARFNGLAATLNAYADNPAIPGMVEELHYLQSAVDAANSNYIESLGEYEIAREDKSPDVAALRQVMEEDAATYQASIRAREAARQRLADALGRALDEESRIYAASWAYRRGPAGLDALRAGARVLNNLAAKFAAQAR